MFSWESNLASAKKLQCSNQLLLKLFVSCGYLFALHVPSACLEILVPSLQEGKLTAATKRDRTRALSTAGATVLPSAREGLGTQLSPHNKQILHLNNSVPHIVIYRVDIATAFWKFISVCEALRCHRKGFRKLATLHLEMCAAK